MPTRQAHPSLIWQYYSFAIKEWLMSIKSKATNVNKLWAFSKCVLHVLFKTLAFS